MKMSNQTFTRTAITSSEAFTSTPSQSTQATSKPTQASAHVHASIKSKQSSHPTKERHATKINHLSTPVPQEMIETGVKSSADNFDSAFKSGLQTTPLTNSDRTDSFTSSPKPVGYNLTMLHVDPVINHTTVPLIYIMQVYLIFR
jgi:cell division septation protein DedD